MIEQMITLGYWSAAIGLILCIIGYFIFPVMIRLLTSEEDE